jgi:hypothetical protein
MPGFRLQLPSAGGLGAVIPRQYDKVELWWHEPRTAPHFVFVRCITRSEDCIVMQVIEQV